MKIGSIEKPTFEKFRESFLQLMEQFTEKEPNPYDDWLEIADSEIRESIIRQFIQSNEQQYGFEIVLQGKLANREGSVEGVVGELYHVFSTMFLVEVINSKIRSGEKRVDI
ncbi:hypothetical protein [Desulfotomaculum sp. 1211_IL3151]|uniref:hypothetical protein n=1 Tax=Desulfotomaculum sp. 1211_IL3151 TaxID=3084055 RepID=UPI002FDB613B